jgi:hypothetical protein
MARRSATQLARPRLPLAGRSDRQPVRRRSRAAGLAALAHSRGRALCRATRSAPPPRVKAKHPLMRAGRRSRRPARFARVRQRRGCDSRACRHPVRQIRKRLLHACRRHRRAAGAPSHAQPRRDPPLYLSDRAPRPCALFATLPGGATAAAGELRDLRRRAASGEAAARARACCLRAPRPAAAGALQCSARGFRGTQVPPRAGRSAATAIHKSAAPPPAARGPAVPPRPRGAPHTLGPAPLPSACARSGPSDVACFAHSLRAAACRVPLDTRCWGVAHIFAGRPVSSPRASRARPPRAARLRAAGTLPACLPPRPARASSIATYCRRCRSNGSLGGV